MSNIYFGFEIGKRGLTVSQTGLNVTGHNTANVNTPGYSRQRADLITNRPWHIPSLTANASVGQMGTGVDIQSISRMRDAFVDEQIRQENRTSGYWEAIQESLSRIEGIVNEPSNDGLRSVMDKYWEAWQDLSANPESEAVRAVVAQRGMAVADGFNHTYRQLQELREDVNDNVKIKVDEINSLSTQLADLNQQILAIKIAGKQPNDLEDKRDLLLDQLSKIVDIKVYYDANDMTAVQLGGRNLVQGVNCNHLNTVTDINGLHMVVWKDTGVKTLINGGEMRGYLDIRGQTIRPEENTNSEYRETIPKLLEQLNSLAKTMAVKTNELHRGGYSLSNQSGMPDGINFFIAPDNPDDIQDWAKYLRVSDEIINDPQKIAAASHRTWDEDGNKSNFGDGSNALQVAQLKHDLNRDQVVVKSSDITMDFPSTVAGQLKVTYEKANDSGENENVTTEIILSEGQSYQDFKQLAEAIQKQLDENEDLSSEGIKIEVTCDGRQLVFQSNNLKFKEISDNGLLTEVTFASKVSPSDLINNATTDDYWRSFTAHVGVESQEATRMVKNQAVLLNQLENKRQSVSGVSLDEEITNMIKFQHAYNAASRFITTIDEQLDQIINRLGLVGR